MSPDIELVRQLKQEFEQKLARKLDPSEILLLVSIASKAYVPTENLLLQDKNEISL
ncbi:hypothetical protein [Shouchella patagoniensis]|uniref:hypothetical protein n=1 Tax=Shouchella patagoniensis TaxID=228576 RepID=UPI0014745FB9|nr:hypothetical protein [Shouchella patagoniensis]